MSSDATPLGHFLAPSRLFVCFFRITLLAQQRSAERSTPNNSEAANGEEGFSARGRWAQWGVSRGVLLPRRHRVPPQPPPPSRGASATRPRVRVLHGPAGGGVATWRHRKGPPRLERRCPRRGRRRLGGMAWASAWAPLCPPAPRKKKARSLSTFR